MKEQKKIRAALLARLREIDEALGAMGFHPPNADRSPHRDTHTYRNERRGRRSK